MWLSTPLSAVTVGLLLTAPAVHGLGEQNVMPFGNKWLALHTNPPTGGALYTVNTPGVFNNFTIDVTILQDALMVPPSYNGTSSRPCDEPCPYKNIQTATQADIDQWYQWWMQNATLPMPFLNRTTDQTDWTNTGPWCWEEDANWDGVNDTCDCKIHFAEPKLFCLQAGRLMQREYYTGKLREGDQRTYSDYEAYTVCNLRNVTLLGPGKLRLFFYDTPATLPPKQDECMDFGQSIATSYGMTYDRANWGPLADPYRRSKANLSDQNVILLLSGTDGRANWYNSADQPIGLRHHTGQILAGMKKDWRAGISPWTHTYVPWFRINNRSEVNAVVPQYVSAQNDIEYYERPVDTVAPPAGDCNWTVTPAKMVNQTYDILTYRPTLFNTSNSGMSVNETFWYNSTTRELTLKLGVTQTGTVEWNFNVTNKVYYPIVVMVDNTTWKLKHFWHPLRRWRISFNDPVSSYPLKKVDRIYSAIERIDPRTIPNFEYMSTYYRNHGDQTTFQGVRDRFYTEELETSESVQRMFNAGFYNRSHLVNMVPGVKFANASFVWNNTYSIEAQLDYAVFDGPKVGVWYLAGQNLLDVPTTPLGYRLIWDRNSEHSQGRGAWYRQYGFFKRGNRTWGSQNGLKQVYSCVRYSVATNTDHVGLSSFVHYFHFDRSRAWDVFQVDLQYPTNTTYLGGGVRDINYDASGTVPRMTRTGAKFEAWWSWWMYGIKCNQNCEDWAAGIYNSSNYPSTYSTTAIDLNQTTNRAQFRLVKDGYSRWYLGEDTRNQWWRGGYDIAGWGNRTAYQGGIRFKFNWVILSEEWYTPPMQVGNYYILQQHTGLVGKMKADNTDPPMFVTKDLLHTNCGGLKAFKDQNIERPRDLFDTNIDCTKPLGYCFRNTPLYMRRNNPAAFVPFGYYGKAGGHAIHGVQTMAGPGGGFFPASSPFGQKTRSRTFVRTYLFDKKTTSSKYCATANDTTEPDYTKRLLPTYTEDDEPIVRYSFESALGGHYANDSAYIRDQQESVVPLASWQLGHKNTTISNAADQNTNIYSFPENHRDMYSDLQYHNAFVPENSTNFFGSPANLVNFQRSMYNRTVWLDSCFRPYSSNSLGNYTFDKVNKCLPSLMLENRAIINWEVTIVFKNATLSDVAPPWTDNAPYY